LQVCLLAILSALIALASSLRYCPPPTRRSLLSQLGSCLHWQSIFYQQEQLSLISIRYSVSPLLYCFVLSLQLSYSSFFFFSLSSNFVRFNLIWF
jgi:hypothetical protein